MRTISATDANSKMFEDLKQIGNKTAVKRSMAGLAGACGFIILFYFNIFGLNAAAIARWRGIMLFACALVAVASIVNWVRASNTSLMRGIEKYCEKTNDPNATMARMKEVWDHGFDFGSGRMNSAYIIALLGLRSLVIPLENALWAYKKVTTGNVGTFTHLFVCYDKRKYQSVALDSGAIEAITNYIFKNCPDIAVGYDKKLDKFYADADVAGFREYARAQRSALQQGS